MDKNSRYTVKVRVDITKANGAPMSVTDQVWSDLDYSQLLLVEKHLIGALAGMNKEGEQIWNSLR